MTEYDESFEIWWENEGKDKWIKEGIELKELVRTAWENGFYKGKEQS